MKSHFVFRTLEILEAFLKEWNFICKFRQFCGVRSMYQMYQFYKEFESIVERLAARICMHA